MKVASIETFGAGRTGTLFVFTTIVVALAELSRWLSPPDVDMSVLWPPTGLILGAVIVYGWPILWVCIVALGAWLVTLQDQTLLAALALTVSQAAGLSAALLYLRKRLHAVAPETPGKRYRVYLEAGLVAASCSAAIGTLALGLASGQPTKQLFLDTFLVYWLLESLSVLLFAPLSHRVVADARRFACSVVNDLARPVLLTCVGAIVIVSFGLVLIPESAEKTYAMGMMFLVCPLLCWFTLAARLESVIVGLPVFAAGFVVLSMQGVGPFDGLGDMGDVVQMLLILSVSVVFLQIIAVVTFSRKQLIQSLRSQANTDFLSGLANDRAFLRYVGDALEWVKAKATSGSRLEPFSWLIYLEVLDFDNLEDLMGFRARRKLEGVLSARLMAISGKTASPARLGNGIYALLAKSDDKDGLDELLGRIYRGLDGELFSIDEHQTRIRVSLGAVPIDGSLTDANQYLSAATQVSLMARERLPKVQVIKDPKSIASNRRELTHRLELLKNAISEERLVLFAQPIKPLQVDNARQSYEILLRLRGTDGQFVSPGVFLPVAEAYGLMTQIDRWVIDKTLDTLTSNPHWLDMTRKCSINLAGTSLSSEDVVDTIRGAFERTGVPTHKIAFEVTETQQIRSRDKAESVTSELREMGCGVSLDDFGTGLATFDYLKSFQFDTVKIDGAFIKNIEANAEDRQIVRSICDVSKLMGLVTVAEFVETEQIAAVLADLGVDYGQGYGLGRPEPLEDLLTSMIVEPESAYSG
ncbi:MAG: EAL domain-containing protein [Hydrogenovibrio sp.]|uniref:EAL domain-containing protein n=1 Tax=Hydrogenovibrio sp. TaxID=2065821 RepID=UPI00287070D0|nr:EAL domain-containing protein [Hydrogenovibrio sp.]MDR9500067.1 EAL domain-containing protein [Hydrogenovibrio sp.]